MLTFKTLWRSHFDYSRLQYNIAYRSKTARENHPELISGRQKRIESFTSNITKNVARPIFWQRDYMKFDVNAFIPVEAAKNPAWSSRMSYRFCNRGTGVINHKKGRQAYVRNTRIPARVKDFSCFAEIPVVRGHLSESTLWHFRPRLYILLGTHVTCQLDSLGESQSVYELFYPYR